MKKITNYTLLAYLNILGKYAEKKLPQKISHALTVNMLRLKPLQEAYSIELKKIIDDYDSFIKKDDKGNQIITQSGVPAVVDEKEVEYSNEISELLNLEIECDIYTLPLDVFGYDDPTERYSPMSAIEIMEIQSVICKEE